MRLDRAADLGVARAIGEGIDQAHIERGLAAVAGDLQHVVHAWVDALRSQAFGAFGQCLDVLLELLARRGRDDLRLAARQCSGAADCSMSAVCTSAKVRNIESSSGRLMNFAKRVCIR